MSASAWATLMSFTVNGNPASTPIQPGTWATLDRLWSDGDHIVMKMDWSLRQIPVDPQHPGRVAVVDGPVVLVERQQSSLAAGLAGLRESASADSPLRFSSSSEIKSLFCALLLGGIR